MTPAELAADRAVIAAATPGPWDYVMHEDWWEVTAPGEPSYICADPNGRAGSCDDAVFIAAARTRWPAALEEIERLNKRVRELTDAVFAGRRHVDLDAGGGE